MGKIKGWKKIKENYWEQKHPLYKTKPNWVNLSKGKGYQAHIPYIVCTKLSSGYIRSYFFDKKSKANAFAIKYMKTHPKG